MKSLIVLVVLTVFMPCMSVAATWDDMLKDEPAVEQSVSTGIPLVNILGKPVAVPPSLKPSYVERVQKVAPNLASMCPGFSSHSQSLGDWTILSTPTNDDGVVLQVRITQSVSQIKLPAGANCFYEILPSGVLEIAKSYCQALCFEKGNK